MIFVISMINDETVHLPRFPFKINKQTNETRKRTKTKKKQRKAKKKTKNKKKAKRSQFVLNAIYIFFHCTYLGHSICTRRVVQFFIDTKYARIAINMHNTFLVYIIQRELAIN